MSPAMRFTHSNRKTNIYTLMIEEEKGGEKMGDCGDGGREGQRERKGGWGHWPGATARSLRNTTRDNRPTARAGPRLVTPLLNA